MQAVTPQEKNTEFDDMLSGLESEGLFDKKRSAANETRTSVKSLIGNPPEWDKDKVDESMDLLNGNPAEEDDVFTGKKTNRIPSQDELVNILKGLPEEDDAAPIIKTLTIPTREEVDAGASTELSLRKQEERRKLESEILELREKMPTGSVINVNSEKGNVNSPVQKAIVESIFIDEEDGKAYVRVSRLSNDKRTLKRKSDYLMRDVLKLNEEITEENKGVLKAKMNPGEIAHFLMQN